jgi:spore germination protein GerM
MNSVTKFMRNRSFKGLITIFCLILSIAFVSGAIVGGTLSEMIKVYRNTASMQVNNTLVTTDNFIYNNTTYVPLRSITELLGKDVQWDNLSKMVSINDPVIEMSIDLYFPDENAEKVLPEKRVVTVTNGNVAKVAVQGLIDGPTLTGLAISMPVGTKLLSTKISGGICTVDFSREFIDNHWGGSAGEGRTLESIVTTLTQFPSIGKVMILVEGKSGETLGNIILDHPLEP